MRTFRILFGKEIRGYFQSLVAYIVLAAVMLLHGLIFIYGVTLLRNEPQPANLIQWTLVGNVGFWLIFILIIPLITMRLFAEEQKLGTLEPLLTAPVQTWHLVLSKYVSALLFYLMLFLPCMFYLVLFEGIARESAIGGATPVWTSGSFFGAYGMIALMGAFFIAIGCLTSAMTSNQIIAAMTCFTILLIYFLLGYVRILGRNLPDVTINFLDYISPIEHMRDFTSGLFDTRPFVYYISFTIFALALTHQVLDYRKWKV